MIDGMPVTGPSIFPLFFPKGHYCLQHQLFRSRHPHMSSPKHRGSTKEGGPSDAGRADRHAVVHQRLGPGLSGSAGAGGCGNGAGHWTGAAAADGEGGGVGKVGGVGRFNMGGYFEPSILDSKVN